MKCCGPGNPHWIPGRVLFVRPSGFSARSALGREVPRGGHVQFGLGGGANHPPAIVTMQQ